MEPWPPVIRVSLETIDVVVSNAPPLLLTDYRARADLVEEFELATRGTYWFVAVIRPAEEWPRVVVEQRYSPGPEGGFHPSLLYVPETNVLFLGAGQRLLAYDVSTPRRIWEDQAACGFWSWSRHSHRVLMCAELELVAWSLEGHKVWSTPVEPPWHLEVIAETVTVDVMGQIRRLNLTTGQPQSA